MDGSYRFETLCSGISLHGGSLTARKTFQSTRLSEPYIAFVLLLEGSLDFGINRKRYRIEAEGGHVLLIACDEEILFSRYLYEGGHTAKLTLKGLDRWLARRNMRVCCRRFIGKKSDIGRWTVVCAALL